MKELFDLPNDITYLNIAAQSPIFNSIYEAGIEGLQQKLHPHTIGISDYFEPVKELKLQFAKLIGASDYNRIANIPSVSYGMASVANNIRLDKGSEIIVVDEQFPSNIYSWHRLAERCNAKIVTISAPDTKINRVQKWNEEILNAINENTGLVAMGHIHWSNGALFNLKAIRKKTKENNALLVIDGSQTIGAFPFSVSEIEPDALICAGYKWLFGPYGCAYGYYGSYFDNGIPIEENWSNRFNSENFAGLTAYETGYKPLANRYAAGEGGSFIYVKMQNAALKGVLQWQPEQIQEHCKRISEETISKLREKGCYIDDDNQRTHHLFGIKLPEGKNIELIKSALNQHKIYVSYRGDYIRISSHIYNTKDEFDKFYDVISPLI
ncbi:MAG: aminotransferase class V-fold PLP-dependent enzyme [Winogradskyella sp.]|nr:aminotransferase class V-fold PLP-dependent enzyme [Winogradskyella sp.]